MSTNWFNDMIDMHHKYGVDKWMGNEMQSDADTRKLKKFMEFRLGMMQEELDETKQAFKDNNPEEIVDGIIDLCVFAIGTLEGRPNPLGLPDLVKPEGWEGPSHEGNHGNISDSFQ